MRLGVWSIRLLIRLRAINRRSRSRRSEALALVEALGHTQEENENETSIGKTADRHHAIFQATRWTWSDQCAQGSTRRESRLPYQAIDKSRFRQVGFTQQL